MRLLFVTRSYPPQVGGMEQYSQGLYTALSKKMSVTLLANRAGKKNLPFFIARATAYLIKNKRKFSHIHFGDAVLSVLVPLAKSGDNMVTITAHGLDITYPKPFYQRFVLRNLRKADKVVCVSAHTKKECIARGVPARKCFVIPNGVTASARKDEPLAIVEKKYKVSLASKKVLFSVSRLVKRKGHEWFVRSVMPKLAEDYVLVIGGNGPEYERIRIAAVEAGVMPRVFLLGTISDEDKSALYAHSYAFLMPNVPVKGDMEGFGISLIEAAAHGLPSVAARLEGIPDAVIDRKTGLLVRPKDADAFVRAIKAVERMKRQTVKKAAKAYAWGNVAKQYVEVLRG